MIQLQEEPIRLDALVGAVSGPGNGALATFLGTVRDQNEGRRVLFLEYHAYPEMAEAEMRRLVETTRERFGVNDVALVHRTGRLEIGEASVAVAVGSPHRAPAMEACRFVIDTLKQTVPIWKKEFFEGGDVWIEGAGSPEDPR